MLSGSRSIQGPKSGGLFVLENGRLPTNEKGAHTLNMDSPTVPRFFRLPALTTRAKLMNLMSLRALSSPRALRAPSGHLATAADAHRPAAASQAIIPGRGPPRAARGSLSLTFERSGQSPVCCVSRRGARGVDRARLCGARGRLAAHRVRRLDARDARPCSRQPCHYLSSLLWARLQAQRCQGWAPR